MPAQDVCAGLRYNEETAAEAHSRRRFLPVAGRRADVPRKLFFRLKDGFPRVKLCFCVLCVLTYLALIRVSGAKLWGLFVFFLCAAVYLYLPGRFWARVTGMEKVLPEFAVPLGVLLGTGFLAVLYCVSMRLGVLWLLRALPPVLGLLWLVLLRGAPQSPWKAARAVYADGGFLSRVTLWCVLSVLFALMVSVKNAHPAAAGEIVLTQDVMWNIGNANSFALGFPPQDIRFSMVRFSYHYLTELVFGALSIVSGIACYDIYVFYAGPLVLAAVLSVCIGHLLLPRPSEQGVIVHLRHVFVQLRQPVDSSDKRNRQFRQYKYDAPHYERECAGNSGCFCFGFCDPVYRNGPQML